MRKIDLTQDSFLMIRKIYVNKDRTNFIFRESPDENLYNDPRIKMETFENRDLSGLLWDMILEMDADGLTTPQIIDVLEDTGLEIIEEEPSKNFTIQYNEK